MSAIPPGLGPLTQTAGLTLTPDTSSTSWLQGSWWQQLQPGSWRGVGFVMDAAENRAGRRVAVHEYPYRDTVWAEDLGRLPRRFAFQAFLVGDDVYQQRNAMILACEQPGEGTLVHPTLGAVQCVLLDFTTTERGGQIVYIRQRRKRSFLTIRARKMRSGPHLCRQIRPKAKFHAQSDDREWGSARHGSAHTEGRAHADGRSPAKTIGSRRAP